MSDPPQGPRAPLEKIAGGCWMNRVRLSNTGERAQNAALLYSLLQPAAWRNKGSRNPRVLWLSKFSGTVWFLVSALHPHLHSESSVPEAICIFVWRAWELFKVNLLDIVPFRAVLQVARTLGKS